MRLLAQLQPKNDERLYESFFGALELIKQIGLAVEHISKTLLTGMILIGRPGWYEKFVIQKYFNQTNIFIELWKRLTNFN